MESCFEDLRSKTFQWGKKGLLSKKRTKKGPVIKLLRTCSRYFRNNAKRSQTARVYNITHFATKVLMFIVVGHNKEKLITHSHGMDVDCQ